MIRSLITFLTLVAMMAIGHADPLDTWTKETSNVPQNLYGVTYGQGRYICIGQSGVILSSTNGIAWQPVPSGVSGYLFGVTFAAGQFLAVGANGTVLRSTNGSDWVPQNSSTTNQLNAVARCGSLFVAVGEAGRLLTSPDGIQWTSRVSATSASLLGVAFGNGMFLAVGGGQSNPGIHVTSTNGINWVNRSSKGVAFYGVAFGDGLFVIMDVRGITWPTSDGILSNGSSSVTSGNYVFGITFAQGHFVGVGGPYVGGSQLIVTSPDGLVWKPRPIAVTNSAVLRGVGYGNGRFIAVGEKGLILRSGPISTLQWTGSGLVLDGEIGRAYKIQSARTMPANTWTELLTVTNSSESMPVPDTVSSTSQRFYRAYTSD